MGAGTHTFPAEGVTVAEFDSTALAGNHALAQRLAGPGVEIWPAVKGNAYGHGVVPVCMALDELGVFGVSAGSIEEAVAIREAGFKSEIVLYGSNPPISPTVFRDYRIVPTVYSVELARAVAGQADERQKVFVKVDCGLGRLGVPARDAGDFVRKIANLPGLQIYGVYTHLPFQDRAGAALTESGLELLRGVIREIQDGGIEIQYVEALASAGLLDGMDPVGNLVNPGHLLYGLSPFAEPTADTSGLRKVLTSLRTRLIHIGEPVEPNTESPSVGAGYGIDRTLRRGIVPVGFFQGYRLPARGAFMLCGGVRVPVMRVSLEHAMLDLSEVSSAAVGDEVVIVGEQGDERIDIEEIAEWRDERTVYSTISLCERATSVWS